MTPALWRLARLAGAAGTLALVVWRVGTGPFLDGLRAVDAGALAAAAGVAVLTTVCCAWRWKVVARGLGVKLSLPAAVAAYYRSQFINVTVARAESSATSTVGSATVASCAMSTAGSARSPGSDRPDSSCRSC
jgi:uncharacterized membrane protein YbhN (UPF0104 family)